MMDQSENVASLGDVGATPDIVGDNCKGDLGPKFELKNTSDGGAGEPVVPMSSDSHPSEVLTNTNEASLEAANRLSASACSEKTPDIDNSAIGSASIDTKMSNPASKIESSNSKSDPSPVSCMDSGVGSSDSSSECNAKSATPTESDSPEKENTAVATTECSATASAVLESVYYVKWINFDQNKVPIVTQNENGPCPLLAIMNVLLLKGKVTLDPMLQMITSEQLMGELGEYIFKIMPQDLSETDRVNYEQNRQDALAVMPKLQTGLDVNVKFTGVGDFEYTSELLIFDLLQISLFHGWLVDPQDSATVAGVEQCSYNQLVERIISLKVSETEEDVRHGLIAQQFLDLTASQLTYHGLCELSSQVKDKQLCIFFRNNHFNTLYKHENELFLLVTDQGFLTERSVVWETLSNVDGDCHFVDASFRTYTRPEASTEPICDPAVEVGSPEQIDHDYQVALSLQDDAGSDTQASNWQGHQQDNAAIAQTDLEFAMRLQEEENRLAMQQQQQQQPRQQAGQVGNSTTQQTGRTQSSQHSRRPDREREREREWERERKEEKGCCIL